MISFRQRPAVLRALCTLRAFRHGLFRERRARFLSYEAACNAIDATSSPGEVEAIRRRIAPYRMAACPGVPAAYTDEQTKSLSDQASERERRLRKDLNPCN